MYVKHIFTGVLLLYTARDLFFRFSHAVLVHHSHAAVNVCAIAQKLAYYFHHVVRAVADYS